MNKNKKKTIIGLILICLLICMVIGAVVSVKHYFDRNTWATILVNGEINSDMSDAFVYEQEYLKGDRITLGTVILEVTHIEHDGTVSFSVKQGNLYDEKGNEIHTGILPRGEKTCYRIKDGQVFLCVTGNRYQ
ncbi:MAG: hypothetical protein IJ716_02180 [Lachnospiraceae bacterium]|nr:hypothetical protein [Lachnospiraceae bacterium]